MYVFISNEDLGIFKISSYVEMHFVNLYKSVSVVEGFVFMVRLQGGYMTIMELVGSFNEQNC